MNELFEKYYRKVDEVSLDYQRSAIEYLNSRDRLMGLKGARGVGKTTLLLQYLKKEHTQNNESIYVSLDDLYFSNHSLYDFADTFVKNGGNLLVLDEVHRYSTWSQEIKNIYDDFSKLRIIYTGSSIVHLHKAKADLSRRSVMYELPGLSFREYLEITGKGQFEVYTLNELLKNHNEISRSIIKKIKPLVEFKQYLEHGYYPYFLENKNTFHQKLAETINMIIEVDLPYFEHLNYGTVDKMKQLLAIVSESVPFKPNVVKLADKIGTTRNTVKDNFSHLHHARVINALYASQKGTSALQKPDKIYLNNTNISYALTGSKVNVGNLRETFFMNQLSSKHDVRYTEIGDFKIDDLYFFEIGGKQKNKEQLKNQAHSFIAADEIEIGVNDKIPLWLFGFLY